MLDTGKQRMLHLYDVINKVNPDKFNILACTWIEETSVGCVIGHAGQDPEFREAGLDTDSMRTEEMARFFGITHEELCGFFSVCNYEKNWGAPAKKEALAKISKLQSGFR